jgi:sugar phosphate permease
MNENTPATLFSSTYERRGYLVCTPVFIGYILVYFHRLCPAVIAVDIQNTFDISGTLLGVLGSAYFYPYALMQPPSGILADSWGPRKAISYFFIIAGLGSILMGVSSSLTMALFGRLLVGLGVSTLYVSNFKLLASWFSPKRFAIIGGIFMSVGGLGALSSSAILAFLATILGWQISLIIIGGITITVGALIYVFVRNRPTDFSEHKYNTQKQEKIRRIPLLTGAKIVLNSKFFWIISLWSFTAQGVCFAIASLWGGPYLMTVYGMTRVSAGWILSMFALAIIIGSPFLSWLSNKVGRKTVLIGCSLLLVLSCSTFCLFTQDLSSTELSIVFFAVSVGPGVAGPIIATMAKETFPIAITGTGIGMINLAPFLGTAVLQIIGGVVITHFGDNAAGYKAMFYLFNACAIVSLLSTIPITETLNNEPKNI